LDTLDKDSKEAVIARSIVRDWLNKVHFASGGYLLAYNGTQSIVKDVKKVIDEAEDTPSTDLLYWMLKAQTHSAKCLNKIKDITQAEMVCEDVIRFVEEFKEKNPDETHSFFYFAVKCNYILMKNQLNAMEFRKGLQYLEDKARPLLKTLIDHFHVRADDEVQDMTKDLTDNRYSFKYRKNYTIYLKKFAFYDRA
jgi:hypothetical protein